MRVVTDKPLQTEFNIKTEVRVMRSNGVSGQIWSRVGV